MSNPKRRLLWLLPAIVLVAATGFIREFLFVNINEQISHVFYKSDFSKMSDTLWFLSSWSYDQLYYLKWTLTLVFAAIYLLESALLLWILFRSVFLKELALLFGVLFVISGILYIGYGLIGQGEDGYLLARFFMGLAQSPVPLMLMIPAIFLRKGTVPTKH